jgi:aminoglycoside N3'-acetyltransferase
MVIGLAYNDSMTFFHHVEEMEGCGYRYMKTFTGPYVDAAGNRSERTVTMFVRDVDRGVETMVDPMGDLLAGLSVIRTRRIGEATVRLMRAREVYDETARRLTDEPGLLYRIAETDA